MLNSVNLMGRLTADPELKKTENGTSVTRFNIAVPRDYDREQVDFITIIAWRKTAEFICQYFKKGKLILVEGRLQVRYYEDKDGVNKLTAEVIARQVNFGGDNNKKDEVPIPEEAGQYKVSDNANIDVSQFEPIDDYNDLPF